MFAFVLRRLATFPIVLLVMYTAAVLLVMAAPGEGLSTGEKEMPPEVLAARRHAFNYDQPWWQRYFWTWPKRLVWDGDLPAHQYEDWTVVEILRSVAGPRCNSALALSLAVAMGLAVG